MPLWQCWHGQCWQRMELLWWDDRFGEYGYYHLEDHGLILNLLPTDSATVEMMVAIDGGYVLIAPGKMLIPASKVETKLLHIRKMANHCALLRQYVSQRPVKIMFILN